MESQVVRRRMSTTASHMGAHEDISTTATATHLLPMSCSNSLNSVIQRRDNRMYFARQVASSQACFVRQTTSELGRCSQSTIPLKSSTSVNTSLYSSVPPIFSRPTKIEHSLQNVGVEAPMFAKPTRAAKSNLQNA